MHEVALYEQKKRVSGTYWVQYILVLIMPYCVHICTVCDDLII
jgi:hypothetical protein